ncbi:MAG: hypothetical protein ACOX45_09240 [Acutalibacteraceae bacterium]
MESELFERWPTRVRETPAAVQGGHLLELVIDNRNGDILALAAAGVSASGQDWATFRKSQEAEMAMGVIQAIEVARITADLVDPDSAAFDLRIEADEKGGPGLQFLLSGLAIPFATDYLKNEMGLALTGDLKWNAAEKAITGRYTLSGLKAVLRPATRQKVTGGLRNAPDGSAGQLSSPGRQVMCSFSFSGIISLAESQSWTIKNLFPLPSSRGWQPAAPYLYPVHASWCWN